MVREYQTEDRRELTTFCANPALLRNAFITSTALSDLLANFGTNCSTVLSVIFISASVSTFFATAIVFNGTSAIFGRAGSMDAIVVSRYACLSAATSCHVAPEAMVTVAAGMVSSTD